MLKVCLWIWKSEGPRELSKKSFEEMIRMLKSGQRQDKGSA